MITRAVVFILINFGALAVGSYLMDGGPTSNWYMELNQAPWTPPGWVFGAAWFSIMVCYGIYMARGWEVMESKGPFVGVVHSSVGFEHILESNFL